MLTVSLEQFEGPLDLLLQLIEREKLDITTVSLSHVTDQYLSLLSAMQPRLRMEELAEFLVVAAKLLLIKSKSLLPCVTQEEEEEIGEFEERLRLYQEFVKAGKHIERLWNAHNMMFMRPRSISSEVVRFSPPKHCSADIVRSLFTNVLSRYTQTARVPSSSISFESRMTIGEKMEHIRQLLSQRAHFLFRHVMASAHNKAEIIVSFLAVLELVKQRALVAHQENLFAEITFKIPEP